MICVVCRVLFHVLSLVRVVCWLLVIGDVRLVGGICFVMFASCCLMCVVRCLLCAACYVLCAILYVVMFVVCW